MSINFADELMNILKDYTKEVEEGLEEAKIKVTKDGAKTLRRISPKRYGDYRKGWRVKRVGTAYIVHNATNYQLNHLLEKGHASGFGGRPVPGKPHIRPTEEKMIADFEREVERAIRG